MGLFDFDANKTALDVFRRTSKPIKLDRNYPAAACFKDLDLVDIPDVMEMKGFKVGAALMRRWFVGKAFEMPSAWKDVKHNGMPFIPSPHFDESIVQMRWVLQHARALAVCGELNAAASGRLSASSTHESRKELIKNLARNGYFTAVPKSFGVGDIQYLHKTCHINYRSVSTNLLEKLKDPIDDLYCALGAFAMHAVAGGTIHPLNSVKSDGATHEVRVDRIGIYIVDHYDFVDNQPLGLWSADGISGTPSLGKVLVENKSFRKWRELHNKGGDFVVFSDISWQSLASPLVWHYDAY